jgi:hypothetical protein
MNISDPLWNMPGSDSASSHNDTALQSTTKFLLNRNLLKLVNETTPGSSNSSLELTIFKNQLDAIIAAITTSGPHLFRLETFLILVCTTIISTIVLPLLAGAIFRMTLQSIYRYKSHWRVSVLVLGIAAIITARIFVGRWIYVIIFAVLQGLLGCWKLSIAYKSIKDIKRWVAYAAILSMSVATDMASEESFPGLTGILPLMYLSVLGFVSDITLFLRTHIPRWIRRPRASKIIAVHYKYWI